MMNSPLMRWLLDVERIPADAENVHLVWEFALPAWAWVMIGLVTAGLAVVSYIRLTDSRTGRAVLAGVRFAFIILLILVLCGPMLELPRESIEEDWVIVLLDRSESLQIEDAAVGDTAMADQRISRDEQLRRLLDDHRDVFASIDEQRHIIWLGFHSGAFTLSSNADSVTRAGDDGDDVNDENDNTVVGEADVDRGEAFTIPELGDPSGRRTRIATALQQALQQAAARQVSGIVLVSDGRTDDPPARQILRRLQAERIPVITVPLGSRESIGDIAVRRVEAPRRAFVRDQVPVTVELDEVGDAVVGVPIQVQLVDQTTGEVLDETTLQPGDERERLTLTATPQLAGETTWQVVIDTPEPDLIPENNTRPLLIELVDRPLRVLFVEGYPRWEYRYIKNLLIRERSIESSVMLISADRDFAQEGNAPITRMPRSPEEFARYDVLVLGDAPATFFSPEQLDMMRDHVAERGAGILWVGGERATPSTYAGTSLADLLPIGGSLSLPRIPANVNMQPTPLAERLGVLQLATPQGVGWPDELADPSYGWSQLYYAQRIDPEQLKPTAETLAVTTQLIDGEHLPLVMSMRFGAGQSIYVATDETWRWRYGRGERLTEQFWIQMIRMLGRESLTAGGEQLILRATPRRLEIGQLLRVDVRFLDASLLENQGQTIAAVVETADGEQITELELRRADEEDDRYVATWLPDRTGELRVRLDDVTLGQLQSEVQVDVFAPEDELRRPETDHDLLRRLAEETDGIMLEPDELSALLEPQVLRKRSVVTINPLTERIWDTPLVFLLALLLLTGEWIGRKLLRLA